MTDHLDQETSLQIALKENGVEAKAKSRFIAAIDRFGGDLLELLNAPMEQRIALQRARTAAAEKIIASAAAGVAGHLEEDVQGGAAVLIAQIAKGARRQANANAVLVEALEDLRRNPPIESQAATGPDAIDDSIIDKLNDYAETASTAELQQRWGRILASEIRKPGTVSRKVLRIVDELDQETALAFERFCQNRIGDCVPVALAGTLLPRHERLLVQANLLVDPASDYYKAGRRLHWVSSERWLFMLSQDLALVLPIVDFPKDSIFKVKDPPPIVVPPDHEPSIAVYVLTDAGHALGRILPDNQEASLVAFGRLVSAAFPGASIEVCRAVDGKWVPFLVLPDVILGEAVAGNSK